MVAEIHIGMPLADALTSMIQTKIPELGWGSAGAEASAMAEYFVLMLANGKTKEEVAAEISGDLLGLGPDDPSVPAFAQWVFEQIEILSAQQGGNDTAAENAASDAVPAQDDAMLEGDSNVAPSDMDMDYASGGASELNAPTGPKAMRSGGSNFRGGREKRIMGQINRAMDRTQDPLHKIRGQSGNERISRGPPSGPRGVGRQPRASAGRTASIAHGLANMGPMAGLPGPMNGPMNPGMPGMMGQPFPMGGQPDILQMMHEQTRMISQLQQQVALQQQQNSAQQNGYGRGKSLFERTSRPPNGRGGRGEYRGGAHFQNGQHRQHHNQQNGAQSSEQAPEHIKAEGEGENGDVDMSAVKDEASTPEETVCKWNLRCTNKDCKFAHQSPAARPGVTIDVKDVCTFGAACKNHKCTGRHPSPATKAAHQADQDCKFFPNCTNAHCQFRHPTMPPCRNGGECKVPNCKFTHVKTACRFRPCTNRFCPFTHEEGQRGTFQDKVWTADGANHVSDRKFVVEDVAEDLVLPDEAPQEVIV